MNAKEMIAKAIAEHLPEFRAKCIELAEMHDDQATLYGFEPSKARSRQGAEAQRNACLRVYDLAAANDIGAICGDTGNLVTALNIAGKLLDISPAQRTAALVEYENS